MGTLVNASDAPTRVNVTCGSFGPATDDKITAWWWSIVAIPIGSDTHVNYP